MDPVLLNCVVPPIKQPFSHPLSYLPFFPLLKVFWDTSQLPKTLTTASDVHVKFFNVAQAPRLSDRFHERGGNKMALSL